MYVSYMYLDSCKLYRVLHYGKSSMMNLYSARRYNAHEVYCEKIIYIYIYISLLDCAVFITPSVGCGPPLPVLGQMALTAKHCPSPRQLIRVRWSSPTAPPFTCCKSTTVHLQQDKPRHRTTKVKCKRQMIEICF